MEKLSGCNRQKFVLAKWLRASPSPINLNEPMRGIDVGPKTAIQESIAKLAADGLAGIVSSPEMHDVLGVSHRILTMTEGCISGRFTGDGMTEQTLIDAVSQPVQTDIP